jgi:hypothetical protein
MAEEVHAAEEQIEQRPLFLDAAPEGERGALVEPEQGIVGEYDRRAACLSHANRIAEA